MTIQDNVVTPAFKITQPDGSDIKVGRPILGIAPQTVTLCKDGAVLCRYDDGVGDYKVDCGTVMLAETMVHKALKLGWGVVGKVVDGLVPVQRSYEQACRQYIKAYGSQPE